MNKKPDFEKMLDAEMKQLIGTRNWNVWKCDIEPKMYNSIIQCLYDYGKKKWEQGQSDAAKRSRERKNRLKMIGFPISITPFKP